MANIDMHKLQLVLEAKGVKMTRQELKSLNKTTSSTTASFVKMGTAILAIGATAKVFSEMSRVGQEFTTSMGRVRSIVNDGSISTAELNKQMSSLSKTARELGKSTVFTASEVGSLQVEFAKLGFTTKEIEGVQKATLNMASAVGVDLATASSVAGGTLRMFQLDVGETADVMDVIGASFNKTALDMTKFQNSITYVGPIAKQLGMDIRGTQSALGVLANNMIDGSIAGTSLRTIMLDMGNASSKLAKRLGFTVTDTESFQRALSELNDMGLSVTEMQDLVGKRAVSAFSILVNQAPKVRQLNDELQDVGGTMDRMAKDQLDNLAGDMKKLGSATDEVYLLFFTALEPTLRATVQLMTEFMAQIDEEEIKAYATGLGLAGGALGVYALATNKAIFATKAFRIALTSTGIGALAVGLGLATGALLDYFDVFAEGEEDIQGNIDKVDELIEKTKQLNGEATTGSLEGMSAQEIKIFNAQKEIDIAEARIAILREEKRQIGPIIERTIELASAYNKQAQGTKLLAENVGDINTLYQAGVELGQINLKNLDENSAREKALLAVRKHLIDNEITYGGILSDSQELRNAINQSRRVEISQLQNKISLKKDDILNIQKSNKESTEEKTVLSELQQSYEKYKATKLEQQNIDAQELVFQARLKDANVELTENLINNVAVRLAQGEASEDILKSLSEEFIEVKTLQDLYKQFNDDLQAQADADTLTKLFRLQSLDEIPAVTDEALKAITRSVQENGLTFREAVNEYYGEGTVNTEQQQKDLDEAEAFLENFRSINRVSAEQQLQEQFDADMKRLKLAGATKEEELQLEQDFHDAQAQLRADANLDAIANAEQYFAQVTQLYSSFSDFASAVNTREINDLKESDKFKSASKEKQKEMMDEIKDKSFENSKANFLISKGLRLGETTMAGLKGYAEAMAMVPPNPVLANAIAVMTAVQAGLILATPAPKKFQTGGYLTGPSHEMGGIPAELEGGEYVMSKNTVNKFGVDFFDELNFRYGGSVRRKYENGGVALRQPPPHTNVVVNISGNVMTEDFVVDDVIPTIKEAVFRQNDSDFARFMYLAGKFDA